MSIVTDFRAVSENAIEQLADRFDDLPRPLLAAIGAGDLAVEQLAALRESLLEQFAERSASAGVGSPGRLLTTDLPARAQRIASDAVVRAQQVATDYAVK